MRLRLVVHPAATSLLIACAGLHTQPAFAGASFATSVKDDFVPLSRSLSPGDRMFYSIRVVNSGDADGLDVVVREVFEPCIDLIDFDVSSSVLLSAGSATLAWEAATRTLEVRFTTPIPPTGS